MPSTPGSDGTVSFTRGERRITLHKSRNLIAVRYRDGAVPESFTGSGSGDRNLSIRTRFVGRIPGERVGIFHCPARERDGVMDHLRENREDVQYCSHVLHRSDDTDRPVDYIVLDNRIFVEYRTRPSRRQLQQLGDRYGIRPIWQFPDDPKGVVYELTSDATANPIKLAERIRRRIKAKTVEPCLVETKVGRAIPSDAGLRAQWHLLNTGQGGGVAGADCNAPSAWDYIWGDPNVTIALIDDGFDLQHTDFATDGKIRSPYDASQQDVDPNPYYFSDNHGTSCAGVALARRGGGVSVGIAPDCSFMPIRHAGQLGDFNEALAFYHAYTQGADVISCSWGPPDAEDNAFWPMPSLTRLVVDLCAVRGRGGRGIPIFFAAGNGNEPLDLDGYANYKNVIAIAASTNEDRKAYYSDYGNNVWVCAPSSGGTRGIFTTDRRGSLGYSWWSDYTDNFGGTSSSTPLVAGIAGLMLSVHPRLRVSQIKRILRDTAVKINRGSPTSYTDEWGSTHSDRYRSGHSRVYGWGRIDAGAAVERAWRMANP